MIPLLFCKRNHEISIVGRYANGKCKACFRLWEKNWRQTNKVKARLKTKKWYSDNPKKVKQMYRTQAWLKQGILNSIGERFTEKDYDLLFNDQKGNCAICRRSRMEFKRNLDVDHNHITGFARGLLCSTCNLQVLPVIENKYNLIGRAVSYFDASELVGKEYTI